MDFLGVGGFEIHHLYGDSGFGDAVGDRLGEAIAIAIVGDIEDGDTGFGVSFLVTPVPIASGEFADVIAQNGAMAGGDGLDIPKFFHAFHGGDDRSRVGGHETFVVKPEVWLNAFEVLVIGGVGTVVHPKRIAGEQDTGFWS